MRGSRRVFSNSATCSPPVWTPTPWNLTEYLRLSLMSTLLLEILEDGLQSLTAGHPISRSRRIFQQVLTCVFRFTEAKAAAKVRNINLNFLLSMWVYLDDQDTASNVIYVSLLFQCKFFNTAKYSLNILR